MASGASISELKKKAVLLSFRLNDMTVISGGPSKAVWWDKVDSKFTGWGASAIPRGGSSRGAWCNRAARRLCGARRGADAVVYQPRRLRRFRYHDRHLGDGRLLCADWQELPHLRRYSGIGGVLEPVQAGPVIIEDNCFIGARSEVAEGVVVRGGSVLSMGVFLGASTKIVDRDSGKIFQGEVPSYSVVVPGALPGKDGGPSLSCAVVVKRVDEKTRARPASPELLRD